MIKYLFIIFSMTFLFGCSKDDEGNNLPDKFKDFSTVFNGQGVGGIIALTFKSHLLVNTTGTKYAWFEDDKVQKEWNLSDPDGPFRDIDQTSIETGMVLQWASVPNNLFIVYDNGNKYMNCTINGDVNHSNNWSDPDFFFSNYRGKQIVKTNWGTDNTFPLDDIGACIKASYVGCLSAFDIATEEFLIVDQKGSEMSNYMVDGLISRPATDVEFILNYKGAGCPPENYQLPFNQIGAATLYRDSNGKDHVIFFNGDGRSFVFYGENDEFMSETYSF
jgi:hypothetical protein